MRIVWVLVAVLALVVSLWALPPAAAAHPQSGVHGACIARHPAYVQGVFEPTYAAGCTGHDEPELDPISNAPGSARDLTWTVILPGDGTVPVSAVGPTFWFGGTVSDPRSQFGQAFVELQFYPDAIVKGCTPAGGFKLIAAPGDYGVCSPVWKVIPSGHAEHAAFNAMLTDSRHPGESLVMHAGDELTIHWFTTPAADGFHVKVTDLTTGGSGTIVLNSKTDGPLMPAFDRQTVGNALSWGAVNDTPNSFVWEIGHTSDFSTPAGKFCLPNDPVCDSYNRASWSGTLPIRILSVTFGDGSKATRWAVVSDFGGKSEVLQNCPSYGGPFCIYPWYTLGQKGSSWSGFHYGVDYANTSRDFGKAAQFQLQTTCGGPFGPNTTYCDTMVVP